MKTKNLSLAIIALVMTATSACSFAGRPGGWYGPEDFEDHYPHHRDSYHSGSRAPRGDYQPHLARAYRLGYEWGARDGNCGFPRNYRRAYLASGCSWESYFMEGYNAGFEGQPCRH